MDATIRAGTRGDLPRLTAIYNHWIGVGAATFDVAPQTVAQRRPWFEQFAPTGPHRLVVAETADGVVGYAASIPFRPKAAYAGTVEMSVYLAPEVRGAGVGTMLGEALLAQLRGAAHRVMAVIAEGSAGAEELVLRLGFRHVGILTEAGFKHGRYWDVSLWERPL